MTPGRIGQLWIIMLLAWNLACLGVVLYFLYNIRHDTINPNTIATLCASAVGNACNITPQKE